ncbi:alpha/beta hydrolase fold domain-containing protein [Streptomyces bobili]|uniref:alpha/beta hydrolase fold domain-containing protein n=1 Tax=Streptomyces bobili TaxID=67280 RepID=UPI0036E6C09D
MPQMRVLMVCGRQAVLLRRRCTASQRGGPDSRGMRAVSTREMPAFPHIASRGQSDGQQRGGPRIRVQLLYYPMADPHGDTPSREQFASGYLLTRAALEWYWRQYTDDECELAEPTASPLRATTADLAGLPPALVVTAEADVVRDEKEQYACLLRQEGVPVIAVRYLGTVHDFASLCPLWVVGQSAPGGCDQAGGGFLRDALADRR